MRCAWFVAGLAVAWGAAAAQAESLTYTLKPRPALGRLEVRLTWQTQGRTQSGLCVAERWGPLRDVAGLIQDLQIDGGRLIRHDGACWMLAHKRDAAVTLRYAVECRRDGLAWDATHLPVVTTDFFFGVGATILLVPQVGPGAPELHDVVVRWELPRNWRGACSWGVGQAVGDRIRSSDLRQAAYLAGPLATSNFKSGAADITVAMVGRFGFDAATLASVVATIAADQAGFMREQAFPPHVVTLVPVGSPVERGSARLLGQGFHHGLALWLAPEADLTEGLEHVVAHELMHYWIGGIAPPAEPEEQVLWFVEGFTDYYALRRLWQSGRWDDQTLARWLNRHIAAYYANPARNAANVEVQARARTAPDTFGELAYQRGLLLGLRWDRMAREHGVEHGVDALTWNLVQRGRVEGLRLSGGVIRDAGVRVLGPWFEREFDRFVVRGETIDLPADALAPALRYVGDASSGRFETPAGSP